MSTTTAIGSPARTILIGVAITVLAALIIWVCSATVDGKVRLSVLEQSFQNIETNLQEIKGTNKRIECAIGDIRSAQKVIETKINRASP